MNIVTLLRTGNFNEYDPGALDSLRRLPRDNVVVLGDEFFHERQYHSALLLYLAAGVRDKLETLAAYLVRDHRYLEAISALHGARAVESLDSLRRYLQRLNLQSEAREAIRSIKSLSPIT